jgi:FkbM family methyltransferase
MREVVQVAPPKEASTSTEVTQSVVGAAYELLLGRRPESYEVLVRLTTVMKSKRELFQHIVSSEEFYARHGALFVSLAEGSKAAYEEPGVLRGLNLFRKFPRYRGAAIPGVAIDFLGTKTRAAYFDGLLASRLDGLVEGYPFIRNFHSSVTEWNGLLWSVLDAKREFVCAELGMGWAPWLICGAFAAKSVGISNVRLIGVEASNRHIEFARAHFIDNGYDPNEHRLIPGAVTATDGVVEFPDISDNPADYGAGLNAQHSRAKTVPVQGLSLPTIFDEVQRIDLLHLDIQGSEPEIISSSVDFLTAHVRWMVIGTHSRSGELHLLELLLKHGWSLIEEVPCRMHPHDGMIRLLTDGIQVWRNPKMV